MLNFNAENQVISIRDLRRMNNKTQKEVADSIGVSTQTYCAWEKDISNVPVSKVLAIANLFGVKLDQIEIS